MLEHEDGDLLIETVRKAGQIAMGFFTTSAKKWDKSDGSPVTEADMAVDAYLKKSLSGARPDYGWLSEETVDNTDRLSCQRVWIVDPIDGTRSFVDQADQWCVSVGLVENGKPVLGMVYNPVTDKIYLAQEGKGATLSGKKISVGNCEKIETSRLIAREPMFKPARWTKPWPTFQRIDISSLALRICQVADGSADGTITIVTNAAEWDLAAADLVLRQAGGIMTTLGGKDIIYNQKNPKQPDGLIAGGPAYHALLLEQSANLIRKT